MDDGMAEAFKTAFEENSRELEILSQNVPIFRSLPQSLERYHPDILFLAMNRMQYDTKDNKEELRNGLFKIKTNPQFAELRIAIQTKLPLKDPFLQQLTKMGIYDIFSSYGHNGQLDMYEVTEQLLSPANIANVSEIMGFNKLFDDEDLGQITSPEKIRQEPKFTENTEQELRSHPQKKEKIPAEATPKVKYESKPIEPAKVDVDAIHPAKKAEVAKENDSPETTDTVALKNKRRLLRENQRETLRENLRRRPKKKAVKKKEKPKRKKRRAILIVGIALVALIFGSIKVLSWGSSLVKQTPSYDSLITERKYDQAATFYPNRATETENKMLADTSIKDKANYSRQIAMNSDSHADPLKFDQAYFDGDFEKVVAIYEASSSKDLLNLSQARTTMLAYAYMKNGNTDDATRYAKKVDNEQLNQKIQAYKQYQKANEILQKKLDDGSLTDQQRDQAKNMLRQNKAAMKKL